MRIPTSHAATRMPPLEVTERSGLPVSIIVNRDLVIRPYQPLFFYRVTSQ